MAEERSQTLVHSEAPLPYTLGRQCCHVSMHFSSSPRACHPHPFPLPPRHPASPSIPETEPGGLQTLGTDWVQACASSETGCSCSEPD